MLLKYFIFHSSFQATNEKEYKDFSSEKLSSFSCMNEEYENVVLQSYLVDMVSKL